MSSDTKASNVRVAAVIPAYNECKTLADIVQRAAPHVDEVIVVDDGSTDGTPESLAGLDITLIRQTSNMGKGRALLRGIEAAADRGHAFAVTLDADGQHPPELIPKLTEKASDGRIVIGSRAADADSIPVARLRANRTANFFISWAAGHWIEDTQCGFRLYPTALPGRLHLRRDRKAGFVFESEILIDACRNGTRIIPVPIPALYKQVLQRPSHFRPFYDISAIVIMVTLKILAWGFYLPGLVRSQSERRQAVRDASCFPTEDAAL